MGVIPLFSSSMRMKKRINNYLVVYKPKEDERGNAP